MMSGSCVMKHAAALGRVCEELLESCSVDEGPVERLLVDASRYSEVCASERGAVRNSARLSCRRPRPPLFAEDYPKASVGPSWLLCRAVSKKFAPNSLAAEPYHL